MKTRHPRIRIHQWEALCLSLLLSMYQSTSLAEPANPMTASPDNTAAVATATVIKKNPVTPQKTSSTVAYKQPFASEIELFVGETRVIPQANAGRLAVGNGEVVSAAVLDDKEILLIANQVGVSSLHVWTNDGRNKRIRINVMPGETSRVSREIAQFLKSIPNSKSTMVGDKIVVEGDNMTDQDLSKIEELSKRYPQIINFTNRIGWEKMIEMDVRVVEFPTKYLEEVGVRWGATGGGAIGALWGSVSRILCKRVLG